MNRPIKPLNELTLNNKINERNRMSIGRIRNIRPPVIPIQIAHLNRGVSSHFTELYMKTESNAKL
nr:hypothetical protein [uncultured bacterium]